MPIIEISFSPDACSRVPLIALEEPGCAHTARPVVLPRGEHKQASYLQFNSKGKAPFLPIELSAYAHLASHAKRVHERPSVVRAPAREAAIA